MKKPREILIDILQSTTIHGLNHVYSTKWRSARIFWMVLFLTGIAILITNVIALVGKYSFKTVTVNFFIDNEKFIWPDLTFCSPSAPYFMEKNSEAREHWMATFNKTRNLVNRLELNDELFKNFVTIKGRAEEIIDTSLMMSTLDPLKMRLHDFKKQILFYGYTVSHPDIYLIKEYDHHYTDLVGDDPIELFSTQFVQVRYNIPCHTFRISNSKTINASSIHSLKFFIQLNYESYELFNSSYMSRSLLLHVTGGNILPSSSEMVLLPGYSTEARITQTRFDNREGRNPCTEEVFKIELYDTLLQSTKLYEGGYRDCEKVLSQSLFVENCNCYNPFLPIYKNNSGFPRLCYNATLFNNEEVIANRDCMLRVFRNFSKNVSFQNLNKMKCGKYKKIKCDELVYNIVPRKTSWIELQSGEMNDRMSTFVNNTYERIFQKSHIGKDVVSEIKKNIGVVSIRRVSEYGGLTKEKLEYSISNLVSDVGGSMGICLGLSAIGIIEMIGMIYYFLLHLCGVGRDKNNQDRESKLMDKIETTDAL